jgi:voltage-gated potassium channel
VFTVEYLLRAWSVIEQSEADLERPWRARIRYLVTPLALADLLAILPFYLGSWIGLDLRVLRVLRLLRVLKLTRYSTSIGLLLDALHAEGRAITAAVFVLSLLLLLASSFAYLAEHAAQPEAFGTIPDALWWAVVTMTTVGYGDVVPVTPVGKLLGGVIGVIGIGMVALPAGLLASGFSEQLHERERLFRIEVERRMQDGRLTRRDREHLEEVRRQYGLRSADAHSIMYELINRPWGEDQIHTCPKCGAPLKPAATRPRRRRRQQIRGVPGRRALAVAAAPEAGLRAEKRRAASPIAVCFEAA